MSDFKKDKVYGRYIHIDERLPFQKIYDVVKRYIRLHQKRRNRGPMEGMGNRYTIQDEIRDILTNMSFRDIKVRIDRDDYNFDFHIKGSSNDMNSKVFNVLRGIPNG